MRSLANLETCLLPRSGIVVVLNAFPGTGKLTILKRVVAQLAMHKPCRINKHLLIDPVILIHPERNQSHHSLRKDLRSPVFKALRNEAQQGRMILMTACLVKSNDTDYQFMQEHLDIVRGTDVPLDWMNAHFDEQEILWRATTQERRQRGKTKLTERHTLQKVVRSYELIEPCPNVDRCAILSVKRLDANSSIEVSVARLLHIIGFSGKTTLK